MRARNSLATCAVIMLSGCATFGQIRALDRVEFSIDGVSGVRLAGIDLSGLRAFADLGFTDGARLAAAWQSGNLPLFLEIQVLAENPADNSSDARMVRMDWTLFLEDRETISGFVGDEYVLPRGEATTIPVVVGLNLVDFYEGSARDLFELALSFTGLGGESKELVLRALPVIQTALGPITYPEPIRIVSGRVGR